MGAKDEEVDLEDWFEAFREQSEDREALGDLSAILPRELGGGKSGAMAALFDPTEGPIVLKWDSLDKVVQESKARRARPDQQVSMRQLRDRGASHIAFHKKPTSDALFGIMAYPYLGPADPRANLVGDFEWFIRDKYLEGTGDDTLIWVFRSLLVYFDRFPQDDGQTGPDVRTLKLPDLSNWRTLRKIAKQACQDVPGAETTLSDLDSWASTLFSRQPTPSFSDSRLVHGDPRFANIMVDMERHEVGLIDFGAGGAGGHIFRDLARFEVDILLRTTGELKGTERSEEIAARGHELLQYQPGDFKKLKETWLGLERRVRVAAIWRYERNERFPDFHRADVRDLHAIFIATELLRRLKWHVELRNETDSGATVPELLLAIKTLVKSVPA